MNDRFICKCECGGNVLGVRDFGRLFTWCDRCTPVETVLIRRRDAGGARAMKRTNKSKKRKRK
jgi:hypothetical protein